MTSMVDAMKTLKEQWDNLYKDLLRIDEKLAMLSKQRSELVIKLQTLSDTHLMLGGKRPLLSPEEAVFSTENPKLGDIIEAMLKERGSMDKYDIEAELERRGRITSKNGRTILFNAIMRDSKKRFRILADGKVGLKYEKADAKS